MRQGNWIGYSLFLFAAFLHATSEAKQITVTSFCESPRLLERRVRDCTQNNLFIKAGEACLKRLNREIDKVSRTMPKAFASDLKQKQAEKYASSNTDYKVASNNLARLIAIIKVAMREVDDYIGKLNFPEDADVPAVTKGNVLRYARSVACFGRTEQSLEDILDEFYDKLGEIESAKAAADAYGNASAKSRKNIEIETRSGQKLLKGRGQGAGRLGKPPRVRDSDISGTKESKEKSRSLSP